MTSAEESGPATGTRPAGRSANTDFILWAILLIGLMVLFDMFVWFEGGGIFSMASALTAVHAKASLIEVDSNALRTPIIAAVCIVAFALFRLVKFNISTRPAQAAAFMIVIGGGFIVDAIYGHRMITQFMTSHSYSRCPSRDHAVGKGKGRVWFEDYVSTPAACVSRPPSSSSPS